MNLAVTRPEEVPASTGETDLVELARGGDERAVRLLVQRNNRQLFRVARSILCDDAEAEDVVQETYVKAFTGLHTFRGEAAFSTWLTRIALNESFGRIRRRRPRVDIAEIDNADGGQVIMFPPSSMPPDPEDETSRQQIRKVLETAIDELPENFRVVFVLRDVEGYSTEQTGQLLGLGTATVKTRLHRGRRLLRAAIGKLLERQFAELFPFGGSRCAKMADRVVERLREHREQSWIPALRPD